MCVCVHTSHNYVYSVYIYPHIHYIYIYIYIYIYVCSRGVYIAGITYAADFISYCVMVHLLWPGRSYVYFNLTARAPPIALDDFSFKGLISRQSSTSSTHALTDGGSQSLSATTFGSLSIASDDWAYVTRNNFGLTSPNFQPPQSDAPASTSANAKLITWSVNHSCQNCSKHVLVIIN